MNRAEDAAAAAAAAVSRQGWLPGRAQAPAAVQLPDYATAHVCTGRPLVDTQPAGLLPPLAPALQLAAAPPPPPAANGAAGPRLITMAEVEKHTSKESAWFVSDGKVYDATPFLKEHPGELHSGGPHTWGAPGRAAAGCDSCFPGVCLGARPETVQGPDLGWALPLP